MAIDKNPRQITRLRVEDQKKLEDLATEVVYNKNTNTVEVGSNLSVNGVARLPHIVIDPTNDDTGVDITFNTDNLYNSQLKFFFMADGLTYTLQANDGDGLIVTDNNIKTVFGKSILKDPEQPEDNNINLYRHSLEIKTADKNTYLMTFNASSNLKIASLQDLTTVLKPDSGSLWFGGICFGNESASMLLYRGNVWCIGKTIVDVSNITTIVDSVKPI